MRGGHTKRAHKSHTQTCCHPKCKKCNHSVSPVNLFKPNTDKPLQSDQLSLFRCTNSIEKKSTGFLWPGTPAIPPFGHSRKLVWALWRLSVGNPAVDCKGCVAILLGMEAGSLHGGKSPEWILVVVARQKTSLWECFWKYPYSQHAFVRKNPFDFCEVKSDVLEAQEQEPTLAFFFLFLNCAGKGLCDHDVEREGRNPGWEWLTCHVCHKNNSCRGRLDHGNVFSELAPWKWHDLRDVLRPDVSVRSVIFNQNEFWGTDSVAHLDFHD